jgi:peptidyl-dipeptidase A
MGMVEESDRFFQGLGLLPMNPQFYKNSVFSRPDDGRDMVCHASAFDLCVRNKDKGKSGDYRIKMCAEVDQYNFGTIHHEMGHTQVIIHKSFKLQAGINYLKFNYLIITSYH